MQQRARQRASRQRPTAPARSWAEPVAHAPDRLEVARVGRLLLDLLSQTADVDGDCAGVEGRRVAPNPAQEIFPGEHAARVVDEEPEQVELPCGEAQLPTRS